MESWIITTTTGATGTMVSIAKSVGTVTLVVVGDKTTADACANSGADKVLWIEAREDVPAEAYANSVAEQTRKANPALIITSENPQDRVLAAAAADAVGARWVSGVKAVTTAADQLHVTVTSVENRVIEDLTVEGPVAALFSGRDEGLTSDQTSPIEEVNNCTADDGIRLVERLTPNSVGGLSTAARVVGVGRGVKSRNDLPLVEELAEALGAEIACTLPVSDDLHWFEPDHVVGRTGRSIRPDLYLAVGLSGQPQHQDGIRDAKFVVAINSEPKAPIFRRAQFGIVGDLYDVLPALLTALKNN